MSRVAAPTSVRRVVASIGLATDAARPLEFGADLARRFRAELVTVFVESADLFRVAELPGAREVGLYSGSIRPIETRDLELQLRAQAARASRTAEAVARRFEVAWSFRVLRGRAPGAVLDAFREPSLVAIQGAAGVAGSRRDVVVVFEDSDAGRRAASTAAELARSVGGRLRVLLAPPDADRRQRREVESLIGVMGVAAQIEDPADDLVERLRESLRRAPDVLLVLPAGSAIRPPGPRAEIETVFF